jgi:hypothetical protein
MTSIVTFADPGTVRMMSGNPDTTEVSDAQVTIYCNTADARVKSDTTIPSLDSLDPRLPLMISAANMQGAILVRLHWGDREQRLPILRDLYNSDISSINESGLVPGGTPRTVVAKSKYRTRKLIYGDLNPYYLSMY